MTRLEEWPSSTEFGLQARLLMWPRFSMRRPGPLYFLFCTQCLHRIHVGGAAGGQVSGGGSGDQKDYGHGS